MTNRKRQLTMVLPLFTMCLAACGPTTSSSQEVTSTPSVSDVTSDTPISEDPSSSEGPNVNDKQIESQRFTNPIRDDRPMVMMHNSTTALIDDAYGRGYGGVVTNVAWGSDYLQNTRAFSNLRSVVDYAVNTKGMYVWLYDELGYPSGTAYGQTLKNNPEYEALGLVSQHVVVNPGQEVTVNLLYGHKAIVDAYVFNGNSTETMDLTSGDKVSNLINETKNAITYRNPTQTTKVLLTYMSKRWYENTHSMENWYAQQRYINMLESGPTSKFINLTYDKYYQNLSDEFGKGIRAFFTDEPAHQGNYFTISDRNRTVIDVPDLNIPIVPSLNYSESLFTNFKAAYGYDLEPYLGYLYHDDGSVMAKQIRIDFYQLTSELFRTNYLGQIADWSEARNVKSSGHLLLEENLYQNPWFAGNMIQLLGTMGMPGTDLLFSQPVRAMKDSSIVSKMASSAADFLKKPDTFSEVSGAFDGTRGTMLEQLNAVGVQVAMGINNFASYYYQGGDHTVEEDLVFSAAIGRMRYMVTGSDHRANVALYYPYEGASAETLPTDNMWTAAEGAKEIDKEFRDLANTLVQKQIDFDLVDHINLDQMVLEDGALVSPNGERFTSIIIPYTTALYSSTIIKLNEAADAGVNVIIQDFDTVATERGKNSTAALFSTVVSKATNLTTSVAIANYIRNQKLNSFSISDNYALDIYMSRRENSNYSLFTVVNAYSTTKQMVFTLQGNGKAVKYYNSVTGAVSDINAQFANNEISFSFTLPANTTGFFVVTK